MIISGIFLYFCAQIQYLLTRLMSALGFLIILLLSVVVFTVPKSSKYYFSLAVLTACLILSSVWGIEVLFGNTPEIKVTYQLPFFLKEIVLTIDRLSAFFIIVVNITVLVGFIYAKGYLKPYYQSKNSLRFSIHFFSYLWLYFSMLMVLMIRDGLCISDRMGNDVLIILSAGHIRCRRHVIH